MKLPNIVPQNKTNEIDKLIDAGSNKLVVKVNETATIDMYEIPEEDINEVKYTNYIEKIIRSSSEYKRYIQTVKREFDLNNCRFYDNIDLTEVKVSLELHHYPATLFDIVTAVRDFYFKEDTLKAYSSFEIAEIVMRLHYEGKVGLVPLTKTNHDLAHNGALFIPLTEDYVFGDYGSLFKDKSLSFDSLFYEKLNAIKAMTADFKESGVNHSDYLFESKEVEVEMKIANSPMKIAIEEDQIA